MEMAQNVMEKSRQILSRREMTRLKHGNRNFPNFPKIGVEKLQQFLNLLRMQLVQVRVG